MCFAHTWCRGVRGRMCRLFIHAFARCTNKCERDGAWRPASNVGDVQVVPRPANTLGRLRIMMPYCIQIRIPTVRCMGIAAKIALSRGNAPPALRKRRVRAFVLLQSRLGKPQDPFRSWNKKSFSLSREESRKMKGLFIK